LRDDVTPTPEAELRRRLGLGDGRLVLTVGAKKVHKNQMALVRALPRLREAHPDATLVLAGAPTSYEADLQAEAERLQLGDAVVFLGYVDDADLEGLYRAATAFAFPSINEGFGLPLLEAMARDLPVACSNVSAMPEVAGDAALQFDPHSDAAVAEALIRIVGDQALREDLVRRGHARLGAFSWARCAEGTLESWSRALAAR
jgi:glycosyltransferase involved in cell wall biosynthesis